MSSKLAASFGFSHTDWRIFMAGTTTKGGAGAPWPRLSVRNRVKVIKEL